MPCDIGMCKKCNKFTQERIAKAIEDGRKDYQDRQKKFFEYQKQYQDFLKNYTRKYIPSCKYIYSDCVWDEEYIKANHPEWYKDICKRRGNDHSDWCSECIDGSNYDDEDK